MISIQTEDFDQAREYDWLRAQGSVGAIVTFTGLVRDMDHGTKVKGIELEHYPAMTEKSLHDIVIQSHRRWDISQTRLIHRVGKLNPNDQIVFVGVCSAHRRDAFAACEFIMDYLKTRAPFWKKQFNPSGGHWVEAKDSDVDAAKRWDQS